MEDFHATHHDRTFLCTATIAAGFRPAADQPPTVGYWHVWTDNSGVSHQSRCELRDFAMGTMEPPAAPSWQNRMNTAGSAVITSVLPVGWEGFWHENPNPQWIVPLSGRWLVETIDGKHVEMGIGEISFGEDQNTTPNAQN